jgi:hypothetical protein
MYEVLDGNALNWIMWSQTKACMDKWSREISILLKYYAEMSGNSLPTFRDNLLVPSSRVKKSKRKKTA